jgi:hypothetical protein
MTKKTFSPGGKPFLSLLTLVIFVIVILSATGIGIYVYMDRKYGKIAERIGDVDLRLDYVNPADLNVSLESLKIDADKLENRDPELPKKLQDSVDKAKQPDATMSLTKLQAIMQQEGKPRENRLLNSSDLDFWNGMVEARLYLESSLVSITIHYPFKGSVYGIHIGDSTEKARNIAQRQNWSADSSAFPNPAFYFGFNDHWRVKWEENDSHRITTVTMEDTYYHIEERH